MDDSVYLRMGNAPACAAPTFAAAFRLGQPVVTPDGATGLILQRDFHHGQYRYYVMTPGAARPSWHWEGYLRSVGEWRHGR